MFSCAQLSRQDASHRRVFVLVSPLLAIALACVAMRAHSAAADEGSGRNRLVSTSDRSAAARLSKLIAELGDETFAVREEATNQLIRAGIEAKPLLLAALSSADAEVRFRARRVLEIVVEGDFQRRLKAFAEDVDGTRGLSLPGWKAFSEFVGNDRTARALFVDIQQAEPLLLEAYDSDPKLAAQSLVERSQSLQLNAGGRMINRNRNFFVSGMAVQPTLGSSLALLWVGGDKSVAVKEDVADRFRIVLYANELSSALQAGDDRGQLCRKILSRWMRRDFGDSIAYYSLQTAMRLNLPEALDLAARSLKRPNAQKQLRYYAALVVGNHGNKEHLPLIEPLLKDTEVVYTTIQNGRAGAIQPANLPANNNRVQAETQMRDVALAVTIKLSEQDPKQFGFDLLNLNNQKQLPLDSTQSRMGFRTADDRTAAFQKWEEWQKGRKQAAVEKPKSGTIER